MSVWKKMHKVLTWASGAYVVTYVSLSTCTDFLLIPSTTVGTIFLLAAIAAYVPRRGVHLFLCLLAIGSTFGVSVLLISPYGSAVPQPSGPFIIAAATTLLAFAITLALGIWRSRSPRN